MAALRSHFDSVECPSRVAMIPSLLELIRGEDFKLSSGWGPKRRPFPRP